MKIMNKLTIMMITAVISLTLATTVFASSISTHKSVSGTVFKIDGDLVFVEVDSNDYWALWYDRIIFQISEDTYIHGKDIEIGDGITGYLRFSGHTGFALPDIKILEMELISEEVPGRYNVYVEMANSYFVYDSMWVSVDFNFDFLANVFEVGDIVSGFLSWSSELGMSRLFDTRQYPALLIVNGDYNVTTGRFYKNEFREDSPSFSIAIMIITEDTEVITRDGEAFCLNEIADIAHVAVVYSERAGNNPLIFSLDKVIVLWHHVPFFTGNNLWAAAREAEERLAALEVIENWIGTNTINIVANGRVVEFIGQYPIIMDGRTLVPVRGVFETLGFEVNWNPDTRQVTLTGADDIVVITVDSATFIANDIVYYLDVPAQIINGRTMLPIRAVLECGLFAGVG